MENFFEDKSIFLFEEIVKEYETPFSILNNAKEYIEKNIKEKDVKINKGNVHESVVIQGNYIIEEGTNISENVVIYRPSIHWKKCNYFCWSTY